MFADSPDTLVKLLNTNSNLDNNTSTELYDDAEGYYRYNIGEVINQRYKVEQFLGQGVFSCVVKATDLNSTKNTAQTPTLVAIKIIRNIESMKKAGLKELDLLSKINEKDTQEYSIIKMVESFTYRNHLCIVFELLEMNLRDVLKNYGKVQGHQHSVGISIQACKIYTKQLVNALKYIQECNIIHADIKPDNILLDHSHQFVKLSDFGSACHISENTITPYLVSRFYRAPEIILGMKYSYPIDMWSIACTIYELYTGKILFTSQNNNDHLRLIMELKGKFPNKVLKRCAFRENHFESDGAFLFREFDKLTKKIKISKVYFQRNTRDLKAMLLNSMLQNHQQDENGSEQALMEEKKQVMLLHDFLEKALALDPSKRLSVNDALLHPFINN
ncbi:predicted protein [Naegleria gruberi]|uniref:non-specific serine/threonine protein kinase n=1 Tax=Naegleria gruberi TaxID=5762 RepID=D2UYX4_NAEGR|nr:uncharacterized protein NAEGRDRAFT_29745 [Naegleria gruberi]EFC49852.1 predicted protein [Naegleria gruberi]|eukprot:XP_002682596.1 predicted protein [Naegleria gruberi strain NEG-M]